MENAANIIPMASAYRIFLVTLVSTKDHLAELLHLLSMLLSVDISRNDFNQNLALCNSKLQAHWLKLSC
jgi:hypothetical protein